jgi:pyruvate formate lyase activating enzyme
VQIDFVTELFQKAKAEGIHTCIDTSGITFNPNKTEKFDELIKHTDLVMLDIKHIDSEKHNALTGHGNENILAFAKYLEKKNIPLWVRHIIVEGITDYPEDLVKLGEFIGTLGNLKALDVLPYHTMGVDKYEEMGINYPLKELKALPLSEAVKAKEFILSGIKKVR